MDRRTFIALISGGLLAAPLAAEAPQPGGEGVADRASEFRHF